MDRLSLVMCLLAVGACETAPDRSSRRRVDSVAAVPGSKLPALSEFCDVYRPGADAVAFAYPELAEPAPAAGGGWRWINVWATWCAPCVTELPTLERWRVRMARSGLAPELIYISVDEDAAQVAAFRQAHAVGPGPRVKSLGALETWLGFIGLDRTASIPIHVFVDPQGKIRCVRTGALDEAHFDVVAQLVGASAH